MLGNAKFLSGEYIVWVFPKCLRTQTLFLTQTNIAQKWQTLRKIPNAAVRHGLSLEQEQKEKKNQSIELTEFLEVGRSSGKDAKSTLCLPHNFKKYAITEYFIMEVTRNL